MHTCLKLPQHMFLCEHQIILHQEVQRQTNSVWKYLLNAVSSTTTVTLEWGNHNPRRAAGTAVHLPLQLSKAITPLHRKWIMNFTKKNSQISRSFRKTQTKVNITKSNSHEMNIDLYYTIKNLEAHYSFYLLSNIPLFRNYLVNTSRLSKSNRIWDTIDSYVGFYLPFYLDKKEYWKYIIY